MVDFWDPRNISFPIVAFVFSVSKNSLTGDKVFCQIALNPSVTCDVIVKSRASFDSLNLIF